MYRAIQILVESVREEFAVTILNAAGIGVILIARYATWW
jgi:hypothetical protein